MRKVTYLCPLRAASRVVKSHGKNTNKIALAATACGGRRIKCPVYWIHSIVYHYHVCDPQGNSPLSLDLPEECQSPSLLSPSEQTRHRMKKRQVLRLQSLEEVFKGKRFENIQEGDTIEEEARHADIAEEDRDEEYFEVSESTNSGLFMNIPVL